MIQFLYKFFLTRFDCPLTLVNDQGVHFINDAIQTLTTHFLFKHTSSIIYYPHGNNQAKSTNKVIGLFFIKLVNEKCNDWDKHLHIVLCANWTTFKVTIEHTPFQLVYGLHPLVPIKHLLPSENTPTKHTPICVPSSQITDLELEATF
jgi:hypothetical protein